MMMMITMMVRDEDLLDGTIQLAIMRVWQLVFREQVQPGQTA